MTIPAGVVEALTAALVDGADAKTALKLALTGYKLVPRIRLQEPQSYDQKCHNILRKNRILGGIYENLPGKFWLDVPGFRTGDMPPFHSVQLAFEKAEYLLDNPDHHGDDE